MRTNRPSSQAVLADLSAGSFFSFNDREYRKVTVGGQGPPEGKVWGLDTDAFKVVEIDADKPIAWGCVGAHGHLELVTRVEYAAEIPSFDATLGDLVAGDHFVLAGVLHVVCTGLVDPPEGEAWAMAWNSTQVASLSTTTAVTRMLGRAVSCSPCG